MSATTKIEWTDRSWNPVTGCTKVSPGCKHCYAETMARRMWAKQYPGRKGFTEVRTHPDRLAEPLGWKRPSRVFVNSMSDLFHEDVPNEFIAAIFFTMAMAPDHTFQILTKRPERMRRWFEWAGEDALDVCHGEWGGACDWEGKLIDDVAGETEADERALAALSQDWPLPNVWLGVSVENQEAADARIPIVMRTPAAVRFLSVEPMLGPVDLEHIHLEGHDSLDARTGEVIAGSTGCIAEELPPIDWVIVGGESGSGARPCDLAWIRCIVSQCQGARVPCFVKQVGARPFVDYSWDERHGETRDDGTLILMDRKGGDPSEWPIDLRVRKFPEVRA